jgi:hypothetical protein
MRSFLIQLFLCLSFYSASYAATHVFTIKKDLQSDWQVHEKDKYVPFSDRQGQVNTIYFTIDADKFSGDYVVIRAHSKFTLFVNGKLIAEAIHAKYNVDSLVQVLKSSRILMALHQPEISGSNLYTAIETIVTASISVKTASENKPSSYFTDFVVVAVLILLTLLIVVLRLNPKLASDYFSVTKIFSLRETDDSQIYSRITSSTNILFYFFCSLILSFYLMIVFHFVYPVYPIASHFQGTSFFSAIFNWTELSLIILALFFLKIILVYGIARLFGSKDVAGIHFFNWVRLLLIIFSIMSLVLFTYFILRGQSLVFHIALHKLISWCLACWVIVLFLKLNGRTSFSMFHLFSYICATEIIPLMIIITVLYN